MSTKNQEQIKQIEFIEPIDQMEPEETMEFVEQTSDTEINDNTQDQKASQNNKSQTKAAKKGAKKIKLELVTNVKYGKSEKKIGEIMEVDTEAEAEMLVRNRIAKRV